MNEESRKGEQHPEDDDASEIIYHEPRMREAEYSFGDEALIDLVAAHFDKHVGKAENVFHELVSELVHLDVHHIPPGEDREFRVLFTTGMAERPMHVPEGYEGPRFSELFIVLPADWELGGGPAANELEDAEVMEPEDSNFWPIGWMKELARLPHEYETWLGPGHTVPNGDPAEPFDPSTKLCCMMAVPPLLFDDEFAIIERGKDGADSIGLLMLMPLYEEEMEFKLKKGVEELMERMEKLDLDVVDLFRPDRPNACARRRWF